MVRNDNWRDGDTGQIPAGFGPSSDKESVIVANLTVGSGGYSSYTAILKGAQDETGVGLLEVYDLKHLPRRNWRTSRLAESCRRAATC